MTLVLNSYDFNYNVFSEMNINIELPKEADEWALNICKHLEYKTYINAPGGIAFFDKAKYSDQGIQLQFIEPILQPYVQRVGHFEQGLSIIDVLMFNSIENVQEMLTMYEFR